MRAPAQHFLILRALGAPAFVVSLALQGIFRGFKDMKTPVFCLGKYPGLNCIKVCLPKCLQWVRPRTKKNISRRKIVRKAYLFMYPTSYPPFEAS